MLVDVIPSPHIANFSPQPRHLPPHYIFNDRTMTSSFQPPNPVPPRTSSSGAANGVGASSHRHRKSVLDGDLPTSELPTKHKHKRNRSSVDGTKHKDGTWSSTNEKILMGPYEYMHQHPGKDVRRQLIQAFNSWLQVPPQSLEVISKVVTMLHTASLL